LSGRLISEESKNKEIVHEKEVLQNKVRMLGQESEKTVLMEKNYMTNLVV